MVGKKMKNTSKALQLQIIEDYKPEVSQDRSLQLADSSIDSDIIKIVQEDDTSSNERFVKEFHIITPIMVLINLQLSDFTSTVGKFVVDGPSSGYNGKGLLLKSYSKFQENEIRAQIDRIAPRIDEENKTLDMIAFLSRPLTVDVMAQALKALLSQNTTPLNEFEFHSTIQNNSVFTNVENKLVECDKAQALRQIKSGECNLIQYYKTNPKDGTCSHHPITILVTKDDFSTVIGELRDNAGFIKTFSASTLTTEYFPAKEELAEVVAKAFSSGDLPFIKFCLENNKLYPGLLVEHKDVLFEAHAQARYDLIEIMVANKLYGYDAHDVKAIKAGMLTQLFIDSCDKADKAGLEMVKLLLALGLNPTVQDTKGYTPLMHAVKFSSEQLVELNKPNSERSEEFKAIMRNKEEIVSILLKDKRIDVNTKVQGKTALKIAIEQGLVKNDSNIQEIRGDHEIINKLIEAGCDPVFARVDSSYADKTLSNVKLIVVLNLVKQPFNTFILTPATKLYEYATHYLVWQVAYNDVKDPLYVATQTVLNPEYAQDRLFDLSKKPMIGAYHLNWNGSVITGADLKELMKHHLGYHNVGNGYFSLQDLPLEEETLQMTVLEKHKIAETLFNRYYMIEECLKNDWMFGWTKAGLLKLKEEITQTYNMLNTGYEINDIFQQFLDMVLAEKGQAALVNELAASKENQAFFYKVYASIKSGALQTDISTRYNVEKVAQNLLDSQSKYPSMFNTILEKLGLFTVPHNIASFEDLMKVCSCFKTEEIDFETMLRMLDQMFNDDLTLEREEKPFAERAKEYGSHTLSSCIDKAVSAISSVTGYSKDHVYHQIADKVAITGAVTNATVQTGFKYVHDNSSVVQVATGVSLGGYLTYKLISPLKAWLYPTKQLQDPLQDLEVISENVVVELENGVTEEFVLLSSQPNTVIETSSVDTALGEFVLLSLPIAVVDGVNC
jgi:hypothetical protein